MAKLNSKQDNILRIIILIIFIIFAASLIYPLIWTFLNSLKGNSEYFSCPTALPEKWLFKNFVTAFNSVNIRVGLSGNANLFDMFYNSIWLALGGSFLGVAVSSMTAYVCSKYDFKICKIFYGVAIFVMIIPVVGSMPAQYLLYNQLGMKDSYTILLAYTGGIGFNFIILYGFFKSVSWFYAEAAFIDGATDFRVFWNIMIPQAIPAIISLFIISLIGVWNDYMTPLLFLPRFPTLATGLFWFKEVMAGSAGANYPIYFAGLLLSLMPILILFIFFSNVIMQNTVAGGLKG